MSIQAEIARRGTVYARPQIQLVTLLARRNPLGDWCTRNRFDKEHSLQRSGKISIQQLIDHAEATKTRWLVHEPHTEFKIEVHG